MRIVLLGDSHLARIRRQLPLIGKDVVNAARGGATVRDLEAQADGAALTDADVVIVSVGTNDAAPHHEVPVADFRRAIGRVLESTVGAWVVMTPPGVVEARLGAHGRTNAVVAHYREAAIAAAASHSARLLDTPPLLAHLGTSAFAEDGLHLSGAGHGVLLPALARCGQVS